MQLSLRGWLVTNSYQPTSRFNIYCGVLNYLLSSVFSFIQVETKQQQRQMFWPLPMQFVIFKGKISRKGIDKSSGSMLTAPLYSSSIRNNSCKSRTAAMFIILMALTTGHYSWSSHNYKLCWWSVPSKLVNQELLPKTRSMLHKMLPNKDSKPIRLLFLHFLAVSFKHYLHPIWFHSHLFCFFAML